MPSMNEAFDSNSTEKKKKNQKVFFHKILVIYITPETRLALAKLIKWSKAIFAAPAVWIIFISQGSFTVENTFFLNYEIMSCKKYDRCIKPFKWSKKDSSQYILLIKLLRRHIYQESLSY